MGSNNRDHTKKLKGKRNRDSDHNNSHEGGGSSQRGKVVADPRFASLHTDPRFRKVSKQKSKVTIDPRFNRMFTDKNFASSSTPLDKRGKPRKHHPETSLHHYYRIEHQQDEEAAKGKDDLMDEDDSKEREVEEEGESEQSGESARESSESELEDDIESSELESSIDTDDEDVVYEEEEDTPDVELESVPIVKEGTRRLAIVNMDWRHVRAVDLYVVLCSFLPKSGEILSVAVYPSEFGLQRMKEEEVHGPVGLFDDEDENNKDEDDDNDDEINPEKLRAYEESRLRYYYAVVECDLISTADHLYKACDGVEFERSSNVLDMRYIPDSMEFKHPPRDVATEAPTSYEGLDFHTKALQHSNIPISWDEDEPQRVKTLKRKFNADQLADLELKEYIASDESETDSSAEDKLDKKQKKRDKYMALIQSGDGSDGDGEDESKDIEITFNTGLEDLSKRILEKKDKKSETVWEATLRKQREKKKACKSKSKYSSDEEISDIDGEAMEQLDDFFVEEPSARKDHKDARVKSDQEENLLLEADREGVASREELELLLAADNAADNGLKGYNLKPKKEKGKKDKGKRRKEVPDEDKIPDISYEDPRFATLFTSALFALDPTDPQYKRSAQYARQVVQRQKMNRKEKVEGEHVKQSSKHLALSDEHERKEDGHRNDDGLPSKREKHELSSLVRSIKMKSNQVPLPSNSKLSKKDGKLLATQRYKKE